MNRYKRPSRRGLTDAFLIMRSRSPGAAVGKQESVSTVGSFDMNMQKVQGPTDRPSKKKKRKR